MHEFAHCVHLRGMSNLDPTFDGRVKEAYQHAMRQGLWSGKYASVNHHEYLPKAFRAGSIPTARTIMTTTMWTRART